MIKLQSVTKTFPSLNDQAVTALHNIDLEIRRGEFVVVTGSSGSGKSTLLFTIGAMQSPTEGSVDIDNIDIYRLSSTERAELRCNQIGFVFQTFNLIPYLNSVENVVLPAVLSGDPYDESLARSQEILERLGLKKRFDHRPSQLSVGERQRVAIGRSLINKPGLILADEPTGNMDSAMTDEIMDIFYDLNSQGQTIIMVTHDPQLAEKGTRHIVLNEGSIQEDRASCQKEVEK